MPKNKVTKRNRGKKFVFRREEKKEIEEKSPFAMMAEAR